MISYLTPAVTQAGLYRGLLDLKASIDRWRTRGDDGGQGEGDMAALIQAQASELDLVPAAPAWADPDAAITRLHNAVHELECTLVPDGLHVVGQPLGDAARADLLAAMGEAKTGTRPETASIAALMAGGASGLADDVAAELLATNRLLGEDHELPAIVRALDGGFIRPVAGGDVIRTPDVLPTGRNLHGFDPFRIPSAFAMVGRCGPGRARDRPAYRRRSAASGDGRASCCGAPTI